MRFIERAWYNKAYWLWLLWPLSLLYQLLSAVRKTSLAPGSSQSSAPVIVVGNITAGGTGKTPLIIALCNHYLEQGSQPGVISRGYGGKANNYPMAVNGDTSPALAGDEPVLIASKTGCPVVVDPDRSQALEYLLSNYAVDIVLSDDGLQHYRLHRDLEVAVVDGQRLFGNGLCLPAGPLREPVSRLQSCDFVVVNGQTVDKTHASLKSAITMSYNATSLVNLANGEKRPFSGAPFNIGSRVQAVAAIGNPQRFFESLSSLPYPVEPHSFPDHHPFQPADFSSMDPHQPIVMTEKDGIKCHSFASENMWSVEIVAEFPQSFLSGIANKLKS